MGKTATTVGEQMERLRERGLMLDLPEEKVSEILLDVGYHKLGCYWHHFREGGGKVFRDGAAFSDIVGLYYFDVDLKNMLSRAIYRIEGNLKTRIIYHVSNHYRDDPVWFTDRHVVEAGFVDHFQKHVYTDGFVSRNGILRKHHQKHRNDRYAPAWKTVEFLNLGQAIYLYSSIRDGSLKRSISECYGIKKVSIFENYLATARFLRNICAHNGVLYDCRTPKEIAKLPMIAFANNDRHGLGTAIKVVAWFLEHISENRAKELQSDVEALFERFVSGAKHPMAGEILAGRSGLGP